jgi:uncharacterized protein (TIGR02118 family)
MSAAPTEIVIPREKAVFWLDRNGRWRNRSGLFKNPRIIGYFHSAIRRDTAGYFLCQEREGVREKVYFPYEDTALFAVEVRTGAESEILLNTGRRLPLDPPALWIENDGLYALDGEDRIKFTDRALMALADVMEFEDGNYFIRLAGCRHRIREGRPAMYKVSVMYPHREGARFDLEYYRTTHMALVSKHLRPFGLIKTEVLKGLSDASGRPAPYVCIGSLYFETADGYEKGIGASGGELRGDIPNFTDLSPIRQVSEVVSS